MAITMKDLNYLILMVVWFLGMALAQGWWKLLAIVFPPYSMYMVAEWVLAEVQSACPLFHF